MKTGNLPVFQPVDKVENTGKKQYNEKGADNSLFSQSVIVTAPFKME